MDIFQSAIQWILDLGAGIFVPLLILILGLIVGMKPRRAFMSAITLGVAFTGMNMVIGFIGGAVQPASEALALNTGIVLPAIDLGWTAAASIAWAWIYIFLLFAIQIVLNIIMLSLNWTKTLNVDLWNVWGKGLTAYLVYYVSGYLWAGFAAAIIQMILEFKLGDMFQPHIEDITGIPLATVTHPMILSTVFMYPINKIMDMIPFLNKKADTDELKKKIGIFSENSVMGLIIGIALGFAGAYGISGSLNLGIQISTAMVLFPMVSKLFMQALSPLSEAMSDFMKKRFQDREVFIGLDWPILAGSSELWVTIILMVPVFIGFALLLPGNTVLPIAGVLNYSIAVGGLLLTGGNIFRMIILGVITMPIYLYGSTYLAPILTEMAGVTGSIDVAEGQLITWSSIEAPELRIFMAEAFAGNLWAIVAFVVFILLFVVLYREIVKTPVPSERYEDLEQN